MKVIKSKDNATYKAAVKLTKKKYRDRTGLYLLEGVKPLADAFLTGVKIRSVFLREGMQTPVGIPADLFMVLPRKLFQPLSATETSQGVIAVAEKRLYDTKRFERELSAGDDNIIIMDRVQDPGNIGTIIRTAEAAGYGGIIMVSGSGDVYAPKAARAAAGSLFRMPVVEACDAACAVKLAKAAGKRLVVTDLQAELDCFAADLTKNVALVIGNEGQGVSETLLESSDLKVKIPMAGAIESLNAAVAAGILMYQSRKIK